MKILIRDVLLDGKRTNILTEGDRIAGIGGVNDRTDAVIDGRGKAAIPGLVNAHTHAAMSLMRGYADDLPLGEWLSNHIWPLEAKLTPDDVYWGTKLACLEMIKSGTTCFSDMYWHIESACRAVEDTGIRGFMSPVFIDQGDSGKAEEHMKENTRLAGKAGKKFGGRVKLALGPHAIYTVSEESLRWAKEHADKEKLLVHIHLSETEGEVEDCLKEKGVRPVEYLEKIGFLGPNVVCAHCVWLDQREMRILGKNNANAAYCPTSNMKLSVGSALDYDGLRREGVTVALGTDGCASNNNLDMFEAMKFASLLQKFHWKSQTALPAREALMMATEGGAKALGLEAGSIREGMLADIALINLKKPELTPNHSLASDLVYAANGSCVDSLICDGRVLMEKGRVEGEEKILEKAMEASKNLACRGNQA